jgi:hypothetical protein
MRFSIVLLLCVALEFSRAGAAEEMAPLPVLTVGSWWEHQLPDGSVRKVVVTSVESDKIVVDWGGRSRAYTHEWNPHQGQSNVDGTWLYFSEPNCLKRFPLEVGKKWRCATTVQRDYYQNNVYTAGEVLSVENITLPAGDFRTFKIKHTVSSGFGRIYSTQYSWIHQKSWLI